MKQSRSVSGAHAFRAYAGILAATLVAGTSALADTDLDSIHTIIEPVCRNLELSPEYRVTALTNQGWVQRDETQLVGYLAMGQTAAAMAAGQIDTDAVGAFYDAAFQRIPENQAREFGSSRTASRWFDNESDPYLGMMLSISESSYVNTSSCAFVISGFDEARFDALTALFPLSRPHSNLFGTLYRNSEIVNPDDMHITLSQSLVILKATPIPVAILTISTQSNP